MNRFVPQAIVALLALTAASCAGVLTYMDVFVSKAPDGRHEIRVAERGCVADCVVRVMAVSEHDHTQLAAVNDALVTFGEVAWTPDSQVAAIYVYPTFKPGLLLGYDFESSKILPDKAVRPLIEAAIRTRYWLPADFLNSFRGGLDEWSDRIGRQKVSIDRDSGRPFISPALPIARRPVRSSLLPSPMQVFRASGS